MTKFRDYLPQVFAAAAASLALLSTGLVRGWSSPAIPLMTNPNTTSFYLDSSETAWLAAIPPLCAFQGSLLISLPMQYFGRRLSLIGISVPFIVGFYLMGISYYVSSKALLFTGRVLTGFVNGASTPAAQIYITECCVPKIRGILGTFTAAFLALGILLAYIIGAFVEWHTLCFILGSLPFLLTITMIFVPPSPYWLMCNGKVEKARETLQRLRGRDAIIDEEFAELLRTVKSSKDSKIESKTLREHLKIITSGPVFRPLIISLAAMFFQQFSGINAVVFHTVTIFEEAGSSVDRNVATIIVGIVQLGGTILAASLVDRYGRRFLLLLSGSFMALSLSSMGAFFYIKLLWGPDETRELLGWLPLVSLIVFIVAYSAGYSNVPFILMAEIFPSSYRNILGSISASFSLTCTFLVVRCFPEMSVSLGLHGAFWFFMACCIAGVIFVAFLLPETKGKTLEEITNMFDKNSRTTNQVIGEELKALDKKASVDSANEDSTGDEKFD